MLNGIEGGVSLVLQMRNKAENAPGDSAGVPGGADAADADRNRSADADRRKTADTGRK